MIDKILNSKIVRKGIEITTSLPFFASFFTLYLMYQFYRINELFFQKNESEIILATKNIFILGKMFEENMPKHLKMKLVILTMIASIFIAISIYQMLLIRLLPVNNKMQINRTSTALIFPYNQRKLQLILGEVHNKFNIDKIADPKHLIIPEKAMFQNFLITGTIGTGKTQSVMYPFTKQALFYEADNDEKKAGFLILDVKGNFYQEVLKFAKKAGRKDDIIIVSLNDSKYNPVHKPNMESSDLAGRCKKVITLFANGANNKDSFWDNKAAQMMTECIRLLRITEKDSKDNAPAYITLAKIHKVVTDKKYRDQKIKKLESTRKKLVAGIELNNEHATMFNIDQAKTYFENEFQSKAETTIETVKACVTEMTSFFVSSEKMQKAFSPKTSDDCDFLGFEECINEGKIVVLALNAAEYPEVSKTIAAYMKLDFQSEIMQRTSKSSLNSTRPMFFISDEYQVFVTDNDGEFYALSRESKCCSIVASQSYTSILKALGNKESYAMLHQNLVNKIFLRTDDKETVDVAQFLTGKEDKEKFQKNITESLSNVKKDRIFGELKSEANKSGYSEGISVSLNKEEVFDTKIFTRVLKAFKAVAITADEQGMQEPTIVHLFKSFEPPILGLEKKIKKATPKKYKKRKENFRKAISKKSDADEKKLTREEVIINKKKGFRKMVGIDSNNLNIIVADENNEERKSEKMTKEELKELDLAFQFETQEELAEQKELTEEEIEQQDIEYLNEIMLDVDPSFTDGTLDAQIAFEKEMEEVARESQEDDEF